MRTMTWAKHWGQVGVGIVFLTSQAAYAEISGKVFQDFNANGTFDTSAGFNEVGVAGVTVRAFDADDSVSTPTAIATSAADGTYALTGLVAGSDYRIEFSWSETWLKAGTAGGTSVQFAPDGATAINLAVHDPNDYWDNQQDPRYVTPQYWNGLASANGAQTGLTSTLYSSTGLNSDYLDYNGGNGTGPVPQADLNVSQLGSVWGEAYHKTQQHLYLTTFLKRHVGMADGPGYIYNVDYSGAAPVLAGKFSLQGVTPTNGGSAIDFGTVTRAGSADFTLPADKSTPNWDIDAFGKVGAMAYGDADMQPGTDYLWAVNLFQKALIRVNVAGSPVSTPADVQQYILNTLPGYPVSTTGALRPWGLTFAYGKAYLGVIDDASVSANAADLKAIVLEFDPANVAAGFTQKLSFNPNLKRGSSPFSSWINSYAEPPVEVNGDYRMRHQPVLSDLEFDENGNMYVSFFDRFGHQMGYFNYRPISGDTTIIRPVPYGEILKACKVTGGWEIEGTGTCHAGTTEFIQDVSGDDELESSEGAVALLKGRKQLLQISIDPHPEGSTGAVYWNTQGANTYDLANGQISNWYSFYQNDAVEAYGKANGLGDVEFILPPAPLEVGNRLWHDIDGDGIQDADEAGIDGVEVTLTCGVDTATATTSNGGQFLFSSTGNAAFLASGQNCTLAVAGGQTPLAGLVVTTQDADGITDNNAATDLRDSDASSLGEIAFTLGAVGENNHTLDIGYTAPPVSLELGNYVWYDQNMDGIQDSHESGVGGVAVALYNNATCTGTSVATTTTSQIGWYTFSGLTASDYCLQFTAPEGWALSPVHVGTDTGADSDAVVTATPYQYVIENITLGATDPTYDLGIYQSQCSPPTLPLGTQAQMPAFGSSSWHHPNAYNIKAGDLNLVGFCLEQGNSDPVVGDLFTVNGADRQNLSAARADYLGRLFNALGDPAVLAAVEAEFGTSTQALDSILQYLVWYYTDWNENFTQVEQYIDDTAWSATQKAAMKLLAQTILDKAQGTNGQTQYPAMTAYWLHNQTNPDRQDLLVPGSYVFPDNPCTLPSALVDLALAKSVIPATVQRGSTATYTLTVTNTGAVNATGVSVTDPLPAGVVWISDDSAGAYDPATGVWAVGEVAKDGSKVLNISVQVQ